MCLAALPLVAVLVEQQQQQQGQALQGLNFNEGHQLALHQQWRMELVVPLLALPFALAPQVHLPLH